MVGHRIVAALFTFGLFACHPPPTRRSETVYAAEQKAVGLTEVAWRLASTRCGLAREIGWQELTATLRAADLTPGMLISFSRNIQGCAEVLQLEAEPLCNRCDDPQVIARERRLPNGRVCRNECVDRYLVREQSRVTGGSLCSARTSAPTIVRMAQRGATLTWTGLLPELCGGIPAVLVFEAAEIGPVANEASPTGPEGQADAAEGT